MSKDKINVLLAGPFPPPCGGVAAMNELIYRDVGIKSSYNVIPLDSSYLKRRIHIRSSTEFINLLNQFIQIMSLIRFIIKFRCRIIHISLSSYYSFYKGAIFWLIASLFRRKRIFHLHGGYFETFYEGSRSRIKRFIEYIFQQSDCVIVLSKYWKSFVEDKLKVIPKKIVILNNCYSEDFNILEERMRESGSEKSKNGFQLLFIGALTKNKGVMDLIDICVEVRKTLDHFILYVVGEEREKGIKEKIHIAVQHEDLSNHVVLMGEIRGENKLKMFYDSDVFVLPSYVENFPVTVVEAMRAGLPVITTSVGAIPEIIDDHKNGFLLTPGDVSSFAKKIDLLANDINMRNVMSRKNIRKAMKEFNPEYYSSKLLKIYDQLLQ